MKKYIFIIAIFFYSFITTHSHDAIMQRVVQENCNYIGEQLFRSFEMPDIVASGSYKVLGNITRKITISANNVLLDLCGHTLFGGIEISSNSRNITIQNGQVDVSTASVTDAIKINTGCSGICLYNVVARNAAGSGIQCNTTVDSAIQNCDFISNTTGVALSSCANILIEECNAIANSVTGFGMVTSTTCTFCDCKALSTGTGNTVQQNNIVAGFITNNGYGNIFERCIANSTQALSTTDYNSLVAGFAFRRTEGGSKIIECEASNATTSPTGFTIPYGILLEASVNNPITLTTTNIGNTLSDPRSSRWSPDGAYVAVSDAGLNQIIIYQFNRVDSTLIFLTSQGGGPSLITPRTGEWDPSGTYIAAIDAGLSQLLVYQFNQSINLLSFVTNQTSSISDPRSSNWSPNGQYIAVANGSGNISIYQFDRNSEGLTFVTSQTGGPSLTLPISAEWRSDGRYISVADATLNQLLVYEFNNNTSLSFVTNTTLTNAPFSSNWSPDGKYLAVFEGVGGTDRVFIYEFNGTSLSLITSINSGDFIGSLDWSPDGKYLAVSDAGTADLIYVYEFDRGAQVLRLVSDSSGGPAFTDLRSTDWSPDGRYLAVTDNGTPDFVFIFDTLTFPSKNVITNNTAYCNSGGQFPSGVGISGSSIENLIIGNTSYSNPVPQTDIVGGGPVVFSNYYFVTNIFNPLFAAEPSALQNLSFGGCEPIAQVPDVPLLWARVLGKCWDIQTKVELLSTLIP